MTPMENSLYRLTKYNRGTAPTCAHTVGDTQMAAHTSTPSCPLPLRLTARAGIWVTSAAAPSARPPSARLGCL